MRHKTVWTQTEYECRSCRLKIHTQIMEINLLTFSHPDEVLIVLPQEGSLLTQMISISANVFELVENGLNILPDIIESIFLTDCYGRVGQLCDRERKG